MHRIFPAVFLAAAALSGQPADFGVPKLGFVLDGNTQALRPINGTPGAATFGPPLALPVPLTRAVTAQKHNFALAGSPDRASLLVVSKLDSEPSIVEIDGISRDAELVVLAASGSAAVVFHAAAGRLYVVSGLPQSPSIARTLEAGGITAVAVTDDARFVAAGFSTGENTAAVRVHDGESGAWRELSPAGRVSALAFSPGGRDLLMADAAPASVSLIRDVAGDAAVTPLLSEADGLGSPAALRFLTGGRALIAAGQKVTTVAFADRARVDVECGCTPRSVEELEPAGTFRLNELTAEPLWVWQDVPEGARILFVPPPVVEGAE